MEGFVLFACIIVAFGWFMRRLRLKEIESFLDSDFDDPLELSKPESGEPVVDPLLARAHAYLEKDYPKTGVVSLPDADEPSPVANRYKTRDTILPERYRLMLKVLGEELGASYGILLDLRWSDFIEGEDEDLRRHAISFLVCTENYTRIVAGIDYIFDDEQANRNSRKLKLLRGLFEDIGKPLILFADTGELTEEEIRKGLLVIRNSQSADRFCPKCGGAMSVRRASSGKNAGKQFWVCRSFPGCKGMKRIQSG